LIENLAPGPNTGREDVNFAPLTYVTLCGARSSLVHMILCPTLAWTMAGVKARLLITTRSVPPESVV